MFRARQNNRKLKNGVSPSKDTRITQSSDFLLSAIVKSSHDAIVSKTLDETITSWNPAAEEMFGYSEADALGKSIRMIIPFDRRAEEDYILQQIRSGQKVDHFETLRVTRDGRTINVSLTISPILNAEGEIVGASKIVRDITDREQLKTEREQLLTQERMAHRQLNDALKARDQFIAVAAHELRNPLQVMQLTLALLRNASRDPEKSSRVIELLDKLRIQQHRLSILIDRLLDVTLARSGTLGLRCEIFNLSALIMEIVDRFKAENPAVSLVLELEPEIDGAWDRMRMEQALINLVSNAIKYGLERPIIVSASLEGSVAEIKVRDGGMGIPPESIPRMFEMFQRITNEPSAQKGLGIGLWLTKKIIEEHEGTLTVESQVGSGSTFIVRLPQHAQL